MTERGLAYFIIITITSSLLLLQLRPDLVGRGSIALSFVGDGQVLRRITVCRVLT